MTAVAVPAMPTKRALKPKTTITNVARTIKEIAGTEAPAGALAELLGSFRPLIAGSEARLLASTRENYDAIDSTVYSAFFAIKKHENAKERAKLEQGVTDALEAEHIRTQRGSSLALKLMKLVTGAERGLMSRQSLYAQGMMRGYNNGIQPGDLAEWLLENGGWAGGKSDLAASIVKDQDSDYVETTGEGRAAWQAKIASIRADLKTRNEGEFDVGTGKLFGTKDEDQLVLLIGTFKSTGKFIVNGAVRHGDASIDAACDAWARGQKKTK